MTEQPIIPAVPVDVLKSELTPDRLLRTTNKGGNVIYVVDAKTCPNVMREIGRLREITFRGAGGGTGKECDIDEYDLMDPPCRQLIVWDPESEQILGGYRFLLGPNIRTREDGTLRIATAHMFRFSEKFVRDYLPYTIELGRSFVRPEYQSSRAGAKALFALDNLWDGLGAITVLNPDIRFLFGKMTMYRNYDRKCRDMLLHFLHKYFPDPDNLVRLFEPIDNNVDRPEITSVFSGASYDEDYRTLNAEIHSHGISIPPLVNAYMGLSPSMRMFGTAINDEFGDVEESGIMLTLADIYEAKKNRHIKTYHPEA